MAIDYQRMLTLKQFEADPIIEPTAHLPFIARKINKDNLMLNFFSLQHLLIIYQSALFKRIPSGNFKIFIDALI